MKFSELYTYYLGRADYFFTKAKTREDYDVRATLKSKGRECHRFATDIAHCLARFGDPVLRTDALEALSRETNILKKGPMRDAWLSGLCIAKYANGYPRILISPADLVETNKA